MGARVPVVACCVVVAVVGACGDNEDAKPDACTPGGGAPAATEGVGGASGEPGSSSKAGNGPAESSSPTPAQSGAGGSFGEPSTSGGSPASGAVSGGSGTSSIGGFLSTASAGAAGAASGSTGGFQSTASAGAAGAVSSSTGGVAAEPGATAGVAGTADWRLDPRIEGIWYFQATGPTYRWVQVGICAGNRALNWQSFTGGQPDRELPQEGTYEATGPLTVVVHFEQPTIDVEFRYDSETDTITPVGTTAGFLTDAMRAGPGVRLPPFSPALTCD
jgi:hypothetical protein